MIFILVYIFKKLKYTLISSHKSALEEFFEHRERTSKLIGMFNIY